MSATVSSAADTSGLPPQKLSALNDEATQVLVAIKRTSIRLALKFPGSTDFSSKGGYFFEDTDPLIMVTGPTVRLDSQAHCFTFRREDSRLTSYQDTYLINDLPEGHKLFDRPVLPTWSAAKAIQIADSFRGIFVGQTNVMLGAPKANYSCDSEYARNGSKMVKKYRLGLWTVWWPRVDSKGHPFYGDHVTIQIQEGFAPLGAGVYLTTPFVEKTDEPITGEKALAQAENFAAWIQLPVRLYAHVVSNSDWEMNVIGDRIISKDLVVVLANTAHGSSLLGTNPSKENRTGRLAWVIWFRPIHAKPSTGGIYDDAFAVWIDAYSGERIGGDAVL
jgi:hypothetical protein